MEKEQLENARIQLGYSVSDLARQLKTPLRTVQDWLAGINRIPGVVEVAVEGLINKDKWTMAGIKERIHERIVNDFPNGIISAGGE